MDALDSDDKLLSIGNSRAQRDIVQFVPFRNFTKGHDFAGNQARLAKAVLEELPSQVTLYMELKGVKPGPGRRAPPPSESAMGGDAPPPSYNSTIAPGASSPFTAPGAPPPTSAPHNAAYGAPPPSQGYAPYPHGGAQPHQGSAPYPPPASNPYYQSGP